MKYTSALLLAIGAVKAKLDHKINIDFNNFFDSKNLVQSLIQSAQQVTDSPGHVTFGQCDDEAKVFNLDLSSTNTTPNPITKGDNIVFNLIGVVNSQMTLKNVHIHVEWNSSPLYDEDNPGTNVYDSDVEYNLGWNVPSFAPNGHYDVTVTGTGSASSVSDGMVMCIKAYMDL